MKKKKKDVIQLILKAKSQILKKYSHISQLTYLKKNKN